MKPEEYLALKPQREFMAQIARDLNKVDWLKIQADCQEDCDNVFSKEYSFSIMSKLLTLSQEQSIRVLLKVIEVNQLAPLFIDEPADQVMSSAAMLKFESYCFDFKP